MKVIFRKKEMDEPYYRDPIIYSMPHSKAYDWKKYCTKCHIYLEDEKDWDELISEWGVITIITGIDGQLHTVEV